MQSVSHGYGILLSTEPGEIPGSGDEKAGGKLFGQTGLKVANQRTICKEYLPRRPAVDFDFLPSRVVFPH
jgi:hypothetical protein